MYIVNIFQVQQQQFITRRIASLHTYTI